MQNALSSAKTIAAECSDASKTVFSVQAEVIHESPGEETVAVSLLHGVVAFDRAGKVVAQSEDPISGCGGDAARILAVWAGQLVPDKELEIAILLSDRQGSSAWKELVVAKRYKSSFRLILTHLLTEKKGGRVHNYPISLQQDGTLKAGGDGVPTSELRWQANSFAFEDAPDAGKSVAIALGSTGATASGDAAGRKQIAERYRVARERIETDARLKGLWRKAERAIKRSCKTQESALAAQEKLSRCDDGGCRESQRQRYERKARELAAKAGKQREAVGGLAEQATAIDAAAAKVFEEYAAATTACFCPDEESSKPICH
jgi:hypothetical protein